MSYPVVRILEGCDRRLRAGGPWIYSNELQIDAAAKALPPGSPVRLVSHDGKAMALAHFNPHSLIAARVLTRNTDAELGSSFLGRRLRRALALRARLYDRPFYRLVHAEGDGLPGLVVDRYGDAVVVQLNSAGMAAAEEAVVDALERALSPSRIILRNDTPVRGLEGLSTDDIRAIKGDLETPIVLEENGLPFEALIGQGQKTGWYFDQRENRAFAARLANEANVLDVYAYTGGFALTALHAGARSAMLVDRNELALHMAESTAGRQGVAERCNFHRQDAFAALDGLANDKARFDLVVTDPPPFARSKKDVPVALKAYRKLARDGARVVGEGGFLLCACCSHNVAADEFLKACYGGIRTAGRAGTLMHGAGASPDHPVHPALPESAYLKFLVFALD